MRSHSTYVTYLFYIELKKKSLKSHLEINYNIYFANGRHLPREALISKETQLMQLKKYITVVSKGDHIEWCDFLKDIII